MEPVGERNEQLKKLGLRIKNIRTQKGISQSDLAIGIDMTASSLAAIEAGKTDISYITLYQLSQFLAVPFSEITG